MIVRWTARLVMLSLVVGCLGLAFWVGAATPNTEGKAGPFAVALNSFGTEFRTGEAVPVIVALGNAGTKPAYMEPGLWGFEVTDVQGKRVVPAGSIDEPPPPPPDYFVERGGKQVFVVPLQEVKGRGWIVAFLPNVLERYHLEVGTYILVAIATVRTYDSASIIVREEEELLHKTWVEPQAVTSSFCLESNPVTIEVR